MNKNKNNNNNNNNTIKIDNSRKLSLFKKLHIYYYK